MKAITSPIRAALLLVTFGSLAAAQPKAVDPALRLDLGSGTSLDLVLVKAGTFRQGSPGTEADRGDDESTREVTLTTDYYIGRTEVTLAQFRRFVADTGYKTEAEKGTSGGFGWNGQALEQRPAFTWKSPGFPQTDDHPVTIVTFDDAMAFAKWLSRKAARNVTLPTEAQWEFAARAGSMLPYPTAAEKVGAPSALGWSKANALGGTQPVGGKLPNGLGLVDLAGNVAEWCLDWYGPYPAGPLTNPIEARQNLSDKPRRVLRGGSWLRDAKNGRSAARYRNAPGSRNADNGFRIVAGIEVVAPTPPRSAAPVAVGSSANQAESESGTSWWFIAFALILAIPVGFVVLVIVLTMFSMFAQRFGWVKGAGGVYPAVGDDGFTLRAPKVPAGHRIHYSYDLDGVKKTGSVLSNEGADGPVVYTGGRPSSVQIIAVTAPGETLPVETPKPVSTTDDRTSVTRHDDNPGFRGYPSAY